MKIRLYFFAFFILYIPFTLHANPDEERLIKNISALDNVYQQDMAKLRELPTLESITSRLFPIMADLNKLTDNEIAVILTENFNEYQDVILADPSEFDNFLARLTNSLEFFSDETQKDIKGIAEEIEERDMLLKNMSLYSLLKANLMLLRLNYIEDLVTSKHIVEKKLIFCNRVWNDLRSGLTTCPHNDVHILFEKHYPDMMFSLSYFRGSLKKEILTKIVGMNCELYDALKCLN